MSNSARQFEMELEINAAREHVWTALTDGDEIKRWFAQDAAVSPGVGGSVRWQWGDTYTWTQTIEVWEPGQRLQTRYDSQVDDSAGGKRRLIMDFELRGEGGSTTLRLVHSGFDSDSGFDQEYDGISRGWPIELRSLKLYLETHRGKDRRLAWCTATIDCSNTDAWERLTGPDGFDCGSEVDQLEIGAPFSFRTADGDEFHGHALQCLENEFTGQVDNLGGAFLRFTVDDCGGTPQVWCWLAGYSDEAGDTAALQTRWGAMLDRMFESHKVANVSGTGNR